MNRFLGLRNLLRQRRESFERLDNTITIESGPEVTKLVDDYGNLSADVDSRIDNVSDALLRLKEFNDLYNAYLGWLADAEPRLSKIPADRDPSTAFANRVAELKVLDSSFI